jgi:molecular chaperone DnaK
VEGPNGDVQVRLRNKSYSTTEILSFLLSDLKASAEDSLGESIEAAVISCPATFYDAQRRAIKEAGFMAGLETVSLVNATTAAALAYQAERKARRGFVAVFHLGGGTFDISIVEFARGLCKVQQGSDSFWGRGLRLVHRGLAHRAVRP